MPSAGGISAPIIIPIRNNDSAKNFNVLNTSTFVELEAETPDCRVYFTTDGSKPNPFQPKIGGRDVTFRYKGPFTLRSGKRTLKAIAVSRDGLKESSIVTKTFQVEEVGIGEDDSSSSSSDFIDRSACSNSNKVSGSKNRPASVKSGPLARKIIQKDLHQQPKKAWITPRQNSAAYTYSSPDMPINMNNSVQLPEGPFNPTNYSGTQVNFWGVAPASIPALNGLSVPYNDSSYQLGLMTNKTLQSIDQPRIGIDDLRQIIREEAANVKPKKVVEYVDKEPQFLPESPGNGNWKGQIDHIYVHLMERCKSDQDFRKKFMDAKIGKLQKGDFIEDDDGTLLLTLTFIKAGGSAPKPKPKPKKKKVPTATLR